MNRFILLLCSFFVSITSFAGLDSKVIVTKLTSLEVCNGQGLAAMYSGAIHGKPIVAGGANFPEKPVHAGGKKVFYDDIYCYDNNEWRIVGKLPFKVASGASCTTERGVVCAGGTDGSKILDNVILISFSENQDVSASNDKQVGKNVGVIIKELPSLPVPLTEASMAVRGDVLYVVGGKTYENTGCNETNIATSGDALREKASLGVYSLDLSVCKEWIKIAEIDSPRLQSVSTVQTGNTSPCLFVFGGYTMGVDKIMVRTDGACLNLKTLEWSEISNMPESSNVTGGACVNSGYSHILFVGGVNKSVFEARCNDANPDSTYFLNDPLWYKFNKDVLVYHTITNSWYTLCENQLLARAGAALVGQQDGSLLYVDGELKPGVRSCDVSEIKVEKEVSFGWLNWTVLILYLLGMLLLGYYFMKRESGAEDFFKGGGRIPWWAAGISIYATMLSAITYMSIPAKAYATDWTYYPMLITILFVSIPVVKYYLPYFRGLNITSAYEYLEMRFNLATRLLASGLFILFMIARMALVLYLPSLALTAVTGINIELCIVLMGIVTIVYCTMGGVEAVVWGDVIQGVILVGGAFFAAYFLISHTEGGFSNFVQIGVDNDKFRLFEWSLDYRSATFWVAIIGGAANNLISYTSDQTVIQRYLTTKDEKSAGRSIMMNGVMCVFISVVFYVIGTGLYTFFQTHPSELDITMQKGDAIFPFFMMSQMPSGIAGLLIAAIFAATMSTISSNINSISTAFSIDFYKRFCPKVSDAKILSVARYTCVVSGVLGVFIALMMANWDILSLLDYFNTILGLLTGGLGGLFFMGVFVKRIKGAAALIGFISGTMFVFWLQFYTDASLFLFGFAGICVSTIVALLFSFCRK